MKLVDLLFEFVEPGVVASAAVVSVAFFHEVCLSTEDLREVVIQNPQSEAF